MEKNILIQKLASASKAASLRFHDYAKEKREYFPGHPIYMREADFLSTLNEDGLTMGEIAMALKITQGAATQIASRLEQKGYITKEQAAADRRRVHVVKTQLGSQIEQAHKKYEDRIFEKMYEMFSDLDAETLSRLISVQIQIINALDDAQTLSE